MASLARQTVQYIPKVLRIDRAIASLNGAVQKRQMHRSTRLQSDSTVSDPDAGARFTDCKDRGIAVLRDPKLNKVVQKSERFQNPTRKICADGLGIEHGIMLCLDGGRSPPLRWDYAFHGEERGAEIPRTPNPPHKLTEI